MSCIAVEEILKYIIAMLLIQTHSYPYGKNSGLQRLHRE